MSPSHHLAGVKEGHHGQHHVAAGLSYRYRAMERDPGRCDHKPSVGSIDEMQGCYFRALFWRLSACAKPLHTEMPPCPQPAAPPLLAPSYSQSTRKRRARFAAAWLPIAANCADRSAPLLQCLSICSTRLTVPSDFKPSTSRNPS